MKHAVAVIVLMLGLVACGPADVGDYSDGVDLIDTRISGVPESQAWVYRFTFADGTRCVAMKVGFAPALDCDWGEA